MPWHGTDNFSFGDTIALQWTQGRGFFARPEGLATGRILSGEDGLGAWLGRG